MRRNVAVAERSQIQTEPQPNKKGRFGDPVSILQSLLVFKNGGGVQINLLLADPHIKIINNIATSMNSFQGAAQPGWP
jgi:hypothetical protein